MTKEEISTKVMDIVSKQLEVDKAKLTLETKYADLGADSLDQAELVMEFEDEFDINISDDAESKIKSIGDTSNYIDEALKKKG